MLLPAAMQLPPIPLLGKKVGSSVATKKTDPFEAFEKGIHLPDGSVGVDMSGWNEPTYAEKCRRAAAGPTPHKYTSYAEIAEREKERDQLTRDVQILLTQYAQRGMDLAPSRLLPLAGIPYPPPSDGSRRTREQFKSLIDVMTKEIEAYDAPPATTAEVIKKAGKRRTVNCDEAPQSPDQEPKAKKLAEVMKAKQELRSLVKRAG